MSINWRKQCYLSDVCRKNDLLKMVLSVVFLFLFSHTGALESQMEGPQNTLGVVGSNVTLKCLSPSRNCIGIEWLKYSPGIPMTVLNHHGIISSTLRDRYSVENSSGCDLGINNVYMTDAGCFICRTLITSKTVEKSAYLIILKTQPKCSIIAPLNETVEGDRVQLSCEVTYNGTHKASMAWNGVGAPAAVVKNKTISRSYSVVASASDVPSFTCNTSFEVETKGTTGETIIGLATNKIPDSNCETSAIKVFYSVRDVTLSSLVSNNPPGTIITCRAIGNPPPTFKWQEMDTDRTWTDIQNQNANKFTMTTVSSKSYRCVAMNVVRGERRNATSSEIQFNNSDASTTVNTTPLYLNLTVQIGVGAGVGVILLIVLLIICFLAPCCPGYKCRHSSENAKIIREEQPLTENPDIYSNINDAQLNAPKAKPRSAEPPKLPQNAPPQAKPRTDNKKAVPANAYHHEEVTYAELAREDGPHQVIPKNNDVPQETLYAAVGTA